MNELTKRNFSYGYVIVASCFSLQAVGVGTYIAFGVFFNPLISEFGWARAALSLASSLSFLLGGMLGILVGRLNDRIGPRLIVLICGIFFGLGHVLMSQISSIWQLYLVFGLVVGIGRSCVDVISLSTTARWFRTRRGFITGIVKVGTGFGQFVLPLVASVLITTRGWRFAYIILGSGAFLIFAAIALLLKRNPPGEPREETHEASNADGFTLKDAARTRAFWTIFASNLVCMFSLVTIMVHIVPHAREIIDSATRAAGILSTIGFVSMGGRILVGFVMDRIGTKRSTMYAYTLLALVLLWLQIADKAWMLYLFAVFYGIAHGALFTIVSPIVADYFGIRSHGLLFGVITFSGTVGGSIGPLISGHIFDVAGSYYPAFWICAGMSLIGFFLISTLKPTDHMLNARLQRT